MPRGTTSLQKGKEKPEICVCSLLFDFCRSEVEKPIVRRFKAYRLMNSFSGALKRATVWKRTNISRDEQSDSLQKGCGKIYSSMPWFSIVCK